MAPIFGPYVYLLEIEQFCELSKMEVTFFSSEGQKPQIYLDPTKQSESIFPQFACSTGIFKSVEEDRLIAAQQLPCQEAPRYLNLTSSKEYIYKICTLKGKWIILAKYFVISVVHWEIGG